MNCPKCNSDQIAKDGWNAKKTKRRYQCKVCNTKFSDNTFETGSINALKARVNMLTRQLKEAQEQAFEENDFLLRIEKALPSIEFPDFPIHEKDCRCEGDGIGHTIILLSDVHYGNLVHPKHLGGRGEYNNEIAKNRIRHVFGEAYRFSNMHGRSETHLHVFMLGDILHGEIHDDFITEQGAEESILQLLPFFSTLYIEALGVFDSVKFYGVVGNHGRNTQQKLFTKAVVGNHEYFFYHLLEMFLDKNAGLGAMQTAESLWDIADVGGWKFLLHHGDLIRSTKGLSGNPDYGLSKNSALMRNLAGQYDYSVCGHFHRPIKVLDFMDMQMWVNGSVIGGDHFSINCLAKATDPCQTLLFVDEEIGVITERVVWLQKIF